MSLDAPTDVGSDVRADLAPDAPADGSPDGAPGACVTPQSLCGSPARCVDTGSDGENCCACGRVCEGSCTAGAYVRPSELAAGDAHTCARFADGAVRCWGSDEYGQIGDGRSGHVYAARPTLVPGLLSVAELALGASHSCVRLDDGTVRCWGQNVAAQLGLGALRTPRW